MLSPADLIIDTWPRSSQYLHHFFCLFILFMLHFFYLSVFFSFLVRVDYEAPVDSAEDIVNRDDIYRAHFCGSGTYDKFFTTATNPVHMEIAEMAKNEKYGGLVKCSAEVKKRQNDAIITDNAVRILPHLVAYNVKNTYVKNLGYDPLYISKQMVFGVFTGFPLRKNFAMKEQLDWVIIHLQAGGFWLKWNRDMFDEKVFLPPTIDDKPEPLSNTQFMLAYLFYGVGMTLGLLVFILEKLVFRCFRKSAVVTKNQK